MKAESRRQGGHAAGVRTDGRGKGDWQQIRRWNRIVPFAGEKERMSI